MLAPEPHNQHMSRRSFLGVSIKAPAVLAMPSLCVSSGCTAANENHAPHEPTDPGGAAAVPRPKPFPDETRDQKALWEAFGDPRDDSALTKVVLPFPMEISFLPGKFRRHLWAHKAVSDSLGRVLERTYEHYGHEEIIRLGINIFGGDHEDRSMTGADRWSLHSWGIAFDFDPDNNQYRWSRKKARFAHPAYEDWWEYWQDEGWFSLGIERDFDWMHVQAANRTY